MPTRCSSDEYHTVTEDSLLRMALSISITPALDSLAVAIMMFTITLRRKFDEGGFAEHN